MKMNTMPPWALGLQAGLDDLAAGRVDTWGAKGVELLAQRGLHLPGIPETPARLAAEVLLRSATRGCRTVAAFLADCLRCRFEGRGFTAGRTDLPPWTPELRLALHAFGPADVDLLDPAPGLMDAAELVLGDIVREGGVRPELLEVHRSLVATCSDPTYPLNSEPPGPDFAAVLGAALAGDRDAARWLLEAFWPERWLRAGDLPPTVNLALAGLQNRPWTEAARRLRANP